MNAEPATLGEAILCVDGDQDTCDLLTVLLGSIGYKVTATTSIKEALDLATEGGFALISLESWFPQSSGVEVCKLIRTHDRNTPILFYSGAAYPTDKDAALSAGANGYLVKPCDFEELVCNIEKLLREGNCRSAPRAAQ